MSKVLIVGTPTTCITISKPLEKMGYTIVCAENIKDGIVEASKLPPGSVIVTEKRIPGGEVLDLVKGLRANGCKIPVLTIVDNLNSGFDVLQLTRGGLVSDLIQRAAIDKELIEKVGIYAYEHQTKFEEWEFLPPTSKTWQTIENKIKTLAPLDTHVVIFGECGTGKEQIAKRIFTLSPRSKENVKVLEAGSAALVEKVTPSEEHSDIYNRIKSYFRNTAGGTIILKNVELLSFDKQSVLIHILKEENPDVRLICTADPKLLGMTGRNSFRDNLFFLLRRSNIVAPALRKIPCEIKDIAEYILTKDAEKLGTKPKKLSAEAIKTLKCFRWPGNIRELRDVVIIASRKARGETIEKEDLDLDLSEPEQHETSRLRCPIEERRRIINALRTSGGNKKAAAEILDINRKTLAELMVKYGIKYPDDIL